MKIFKGILIFIFVFSAHSAVIEVDGVVCNLHDAINAASLNSAVGGCSSGDSGEDVLNLTPDTTFVLTNPDPVINSFGLNIRTELTIEGNGSTIERDNSAVDFGILLIDTTGKVTINNLTLRNGRNPSNYGAGILVSGASAILTLNHTNVVDNIGGGVFIESTFISNVTQHVIRNSRIANNSTYPGSNESSGGILIVRSNVSIINSTIDNNISDYDGGGVKLVQAELEMLNSTISGNISTGSGGGIFVFQRHNIVKLIGVTVSDNYSLISGGGLDFSIGGDPSINNYFELYSSLISGNTAGVDANEINGPIDQGVVLAGYNIIGSNGSSDSINIILGSNDLAPIEQVNDILLPLNDAENYLKTHQLVTGSPAIDYAPNNCVAETDQIGTQRRLDGDNDGVSGCDIGAIEFVSDLIFYSDFE